MFKNLTRSIMALAMFGGAVGFATQASADITQCVTNNGDYQITVDWYKSSDVVIDNSEPWNNRLLLKRDKRLGTGKCGQNAETGKVECQGVHVKPQSSRVLRSLAKQDNKQSCVTSPEGDMFAIVKCNGCTTGTEIVTAAAGTVAGMALPGGSIGSVIHSVADSQGAGINSSINQLVSTASKNIRVKGKVAQNLTIHDASDLADSYDMSDVIFVGTPSNVQSKGAFFSAHAYEKKNTLPRFAYRYTVEIDCYMALNAFFKHVEHADTRDTIIVKFMTKGKVVSSKMIKGDDINCSATGADTRWTSASLGERVDRIRIETTGQDAFLMDEVKLSFYQTGGLEANGSFNVNIGGGTDDEKGWCLSTDPNDKFKGYADRCIPAWEFVVR